MSQQWFIKTKQGEVGPVAPNKLRQLATDGKLKPNSLIRRSDMSQWVHASRANGLFVKSEPQKKAPPPTASPPIEPKTDTELFEDLVMAELVEPLRGKPKRKKWRLFRHRPTGKNFQFLIAEDRTDVENDRRYRMSHWDSVNSLIWGTAQRKDWRIFSDEEPVVGVTQDNREINFLLLGDQLDFRIFVEREPENPYDPNAIRVMASATVDDEHLTEQLGYLSKETARGRGRDRRATIRRFFALSGSKLWVANPHFRPIPGVS